MSANSEELQVALLEYTKDTLTYIHTVKTFWETSSKWMRSRETEVETLRGIKDRADNLEPNFSDVTQSESKGEAFWQYMKKTFNSSSVDRQRAELESELAELLKDVLQGLQELSSFLQAVKKLASASMAVFTENQLLHLPRDVTLDYIQVVVSAAKAVCPLVLDFKIDMNPFFLPRLQNMEVLAYQLDEYIQNTSSICGMFRKSFSEKLQVALLGYTKDTLTYIHTVRTFCKTSCKWMRSRETELDMMIGIKERTESKGKAFLQYMKKTFKSSSVDRQRAELESELAELLKDVLQVLKEISSFLEAVEKLASTSLEVFTENQLLHLPRDVTLDYIQVVVLAAKAVCPLVLDFKIDMDPFFIPRLQNLEVLAYQLEKYIQTISSICEMFGESDFSDFDLETVGETEVDLSAGLPEEDFQRMLDHINQLVEIRNDPHFRMAFLFQQKPGEHFVTEFKNRQPGMLMFLKDLEETAVQLDRMNKGARISAVAGSSVGAVGGILSIVGLALIPVTAGVSLSLTLAGVGLGVTSGVNGMVTTLTELGVNKTQQNKAKNTFQSFMEDVQILQDCVDEAKCQIDSKLGVNQGEVGVGVVKVLGRTAAVGIGIDSMVDATSAIRLLKIPRVAPDIPDLGQAAVKGPLALCKTARAGFITLNALFLGMDVFMICTNSMDLAKGSETQVSKFIRARTELWRSVMDSWQKMSDSLVQGLPTLEEKEAVLETPFYPETEVKKQKETDEEVM